MDRFQVWAILSATLLFLCFRSNFRGCLCQDQSIANSMNCLDKSGVRWVIFDLLTQATDRWFEELRRLTVRKSPRRGEELAMGQYHSGMFQHMFQQAKFRGSQRHSFPMQRHLVQWDIYYQFPRVKERLL